MSQTRVCDTTQPRRLIHMDRPGANPESSPKPALLGCHRLAKLQLPSVGDLPPTGSTLAPPLTGLTCGLQMIEGLQRAGVEFRSPAEDFDTRHRPAPALVGGNRILCAVHGRLPA